MPLSKERQKQWMKEYRLRKKGVIVIPKVEKPIIPKIPGLMMQGNKIVGMDRMTDKPEESKLPICDEHNFRQFKPGDRVLVRRGRRLIETVIPELDAEGNVIQN